jgi:hypothetical protein
VSVDNYGLWNFIDPSIEGSADVPASCWPSAFVAPLSNQALMHAALAKCISDYGAGSYTTPVFSKPGPEVDGLQLYAIQQSPRLVYLPEFRESATTSCNVLDCLHIVRFHAVFLQTLYIQCNGNNCDVSFDPGPWNTTPLGSGNKTAQAVTGFVLPDHMLPGTLGSSPGTLGQNAVVKLVG